MPFASFIFKSPIPTEEGDSPAMNEGLQLNLLGEEGALIPNVCRSLKRVIKKGYFRGELNAPSGSGVYTHSWTVNPSLASPCSPLRQRIRGSKRLITVDLYALAIMAPI